MFFLSALKIPLSNQIWNLRQWVLVCFSRFQCSTVPTISVETCRSSRTDKTTPHTKIPMTKLKDTNLSFQDKEDWSIEMRTKGKVKGGGSERTENETDRLPFPPIHCGGVFRSQPASFQKGPVKETAPWPLSARVIKPGKQSVVHHVWDCNPQVELSPTCTPVFRNLSLQPTPHGTSPGDKKLR